LPSPRLTPKDRGTLSVLDKPPLAELPFFVALQITRRKIFRLPSFCAFASLLSYPARGRRGDRNPQSQAGGSLGERDRSFAYAASDRPRECPGSQGRRAISVPCRSEVMPSSFVCHSRIFCVPSGYLLCHNDRRANFRNISLRKKARVAPGRANPGRSSY